MPLSHFPKSPKILPGFRLIEEIDHTRAFVEIGKRIKTDEGTPIFLQLPKCFIIKLPHPLGVGVQIHLAEIRSLSLHLQDDRIPLLPG